MPDIPPPLPPRLRRGNRQPVQDFSPDEVLYLRVPPLQLDEEELDFFPPTKIPSPAFSVNRGRFSEPQDVIINRPGYGIAAFIVRDVPPSIATGPNAVYEFRVVHEPCEVYCNAITRNEPCDCNYAHSEIQVFKDGKKIENNRVPKSVKPAFKDILSKKILIIQQPSREPYES